MVSPRVIGILIAIWQADSFAPNLPKVCGSRMQLRLSSPTAPSINDVFPNLVGRTQDTDDFDLYEYLGDDWGIMFMHPGDFTPVCTTELGVAANVQKKFERHGCKIVGFSCNDADSHREWIKDIKSATGAEVKFPLFCDPYRRCASWLGILDETNRDDAGLPMTVRSVYILKPNKQVALMLTYPASTGRNFDELYRVFQSVKMTAETAVATPANWKKGDSVMIDMPLSNADADIVFGKGGYRIVNMPSEKGHHQSKNYMRYTRDPSANLLKRLKRKIPGIRDVSLGNAASLFCVVGLFAVFPQLAQAFGQRLLK